MVRIIFGFLVFFSFSHPHISKIQLEKKIREIAVREKRPGFSKSCWFVSLDILRSLGISEAKPEIVSPSSTATNVEDSPSKKKVTLESFFTKISKSDTSTECKDAFHDLPNEKNLERETPNEALEFPLSFQVPTSTPNPDQVTSSVNNAVPLALHCFPTTKSARRVTPTLILNPLISSTCKFSSLPSDSSSTVAIIRKAPTEAEVATTTTTTTVMTVGTTGKTGELAITRLTIDYIFFELF